MAYERDPSYLFANRDFDQLREKQAEYSSIYLDHPYWPEAKFRARLTEIKNGFDLTRLNIAGQSVENDLQDLAIKYDRVKFQNMNDILLIDALFGRIIGCCNEILNDGATGKLSGDSFQKYLKCYREAFNANKHNGLDNWQTESAKQIAIWIEKLIN